MFLITNKGFNPAVGLGLCALWLPFAQTAQAGCGDVPWNVGVINAQWAVYTAAPFANRLTMVAREYGDQPQPSGAGIVGMWAFKFTAKNSPPFLDGALIDAGFAQWHNDGTEITNSGARDPRTGNYCLGVWKKTGPSTYKLNHQGLSWDPAGNFIGPATIIEEVTVDAGSLTFSGEFTIVQYDTKGNVIAHIAGDVTARRVEVD